MKKYLRKKTKAILNLTMIFLLLIGTTLQAEELKDINGHWAELSLARGIELGWINGYEDKTIRPENTISRAQYISLMMQTLKNYQLPESTYSTYIDRESVSWQRLHFHRQNQLD